MPQQTPSNATVGFVLITNLTLWKHSEWSLISVPNMSYCRYENTSKDFNDGDRRIALNKKQSEIAKKVLDILITSYSTDAKDFEEVLRIERQLLKYQLAHQKALTDKNAAVAFIDYLLGK